MEKFKMENNPKSAVSEAFRTLRTNIQFTMIDKKIKTIVITSTKAYEGKTTIAKNVAFTMANAGKKVLIVDADLRRSKLHKNFDLPNEEGLSNILAGKTDIEPHKIEGFESLYVLTAGVHPPNPSELLGSHRMKEYIESLKEVYDTIIIDTPPVGIVTDGALVASFADGTIFVCASGETDVKSAQYSKGLLENVNANILGVVLNKMPINKGGYYNYPTYDTYCDEPNHKKKKFRFLKKARI